ncbi:MAG: hypothetical protein WC346_02135 [Methanogenium sp.]|jgi:hypothetical protein
MVRKVKNRDLTSYATDGKLAVINRDLSSYESDGLNPPLKQGTKVRIANYFKACVADDQVAVLIDGILGYVAIPADCLTE